VLNHPTVLRWAKPIPHPRIDTGNFRNRNSETFQRRDTLDLLLKWSIVVILPMQRLALTEKIAHELLGGVHDG
jgi:hypothetical protein